jgi:hypothetical protein
MGLVVGLKHTHGGTEGHYGETLLAGRGERPGADARLAALVEDETGRKL